MPSTLFRSAAATGAILVVTALAACASGAAPESESDYVTDGKFTVATGEPAYYPYVIDDEPESGEGFESAVAYAVADELGFAADDVVWVRSTFDSAIAPGAKDFDVNLQQFTISDERRDAVDFSSSYYSTPQAVITVEGSPAAEASSIADLSGYLIGAATGTTSFTTIEEVIQPSSAAQAFNSNDDAKLALENGTVDAIVVDLPTAYYLTGVELTGGVLIGQLPVSGIADEWGIVLEKDSPLTDEVSAAVDTLREDGTLQEITDEWLGADAGAPVLE
ncbi:polar amino acid transport system substrate-binding protein [Conyzicola lurida]|uniref:Polar amino acid transport system substrate-binding protein n=1 Tax=Conyzicola lurida TaxID=1172621 RepID=A0A841ALR0_9MICO|nr:ABC transporter substrate-binding protein [Conyzicola lurida]MBB5842573.1 polar amino acid transport system substrate-binding protein [Conyzicola lurida]